MKLVLSREAIRDLRRISGWTYQRFGGRQARSCIAALEKRCADLADNHLSGQSVEDIAMGLRKLRVNSHMIYFRIDGNELIVLRVLHGRQDVGCHL